MVRIDTQVAQRGLQGSSTPNIQLSSAVGQELSAAGAAVEDAASVFIQRQEQKENFRAENDYRKLKLDLQRELEERAQQIEEGGDGFHDTFIAEAFRPKRDEFLARVPERLRPQFEAVLADETGADATDWSIRAATVERDESYRWYKQEITATHQQMANAIAMDPEGYDAYLEEGAALIETSGLPTPEKALLRQQWEETAQVAYFNQLLTDDPQGVLRELGVDTRDLSPTTQFSMLSRAVQWAESSDNPDAVSGKGAIGLMQVMPATAQEIARELQDPDFPTGAPEGAIAAYLSNPHVNKMYGEHYLRKQLQEFRGTRNPIESALVAYNAGPSVAKKWVESGYNDAMLPKETRDYKKKILDSMSSPAAKGDPQRVAFVTRDGKPLADDQTNPELRDRVADAFATVGLDKVKVNSARRSGAKNKEVGGADESQHLVGNALDIDVGGMPHRERIELIKALSAAGVTGIGVYANTIHADLGGRRAWGPNHHFDTVPPWATGVIAEHLKGTTPPPRAIGGRAASMPYDTRQKFVNQADQAIAAQQVEAAKSTAVEKVEIRRARDNELALIRATGQGSGNLDEAAIQTILGEDDFLKYARDRDVAQRTFTATSGISTMGMSEMEQRFSEYEPNPGAADFDDQQRIQAAVQKEIDRVTKLRANSPDKAALEFPEVKGAYDTLQQEIGSGAAEPAGVQEFVRTMLEAQGELDIAPEARAPIPSEWAIEIGRSLTRVPETAGRNLEDVRAAIIVQYNELQKYFGDYTDEVILYSISEYKGLSSNTAEIVTAYMQAIQAGGDPFRSRKLDSAIDADQVESMSFWDRGMENLRQSFGFGTDEEADIDGDEPTPEEILRRQELEAEAP